MDDLKKLLVKFILWAIRLELLIYSMLVFITILLILTLLAIVLGTI